MPELPDVQVFKEYIDATSLHRRIKAAHVSASGLLRGVSAQTLRNRLGGHELARTRRHGKHLFVRIDGGPWLRLHFGMTGDVVHVGRGEDAPEHTRLHLEFARGGLAYRNPRKLGQIGLVEDVDEFIEENDLGPDALSGELDLETFRDVVRGHHGAVKSTLMNQAVIAGIGNVYADEVLFAAGIHPEAQANRLRDETLGDLHRAMIRILKRAVAARVDPDRMPSSFLLPHREEGGTCPRCGRRLTVSRVGGRATYHCSRDQQKKH